MYTDILKTELCCSGTTKYWELNTITRISNW